MRHANAEAEDSNLKTELVTWNAERIQDQEPRSFIQDQPLIRFRPPQLLFSQRNFAASKPPCLYSLVPVDSPPEFYPSPGSLRCPVDPQVPTASPQAPQDRRLAHPPAPLTTTARNSRSSQFSPSSPSAQAPTSSLSSLALALANRPRTRSRSPRDRLYPSIRETHTHTHTPLNPS